MDKEVKEYIIVFEDGEYKKYEDGIFITTKERDNEKVEIINTSKIKKAEFNIYVSALKKIIKTLEGERDKAVSEIIKADFLEVLEEFEKFLEEKMKK